MRCGDAARRAEMWQERWVKLLAQEANRGVRNSERTLLAGYILEDIEVLPILRRPAPQLVAEITEARGAVLAPRWTTARPNDSGPWGRQQKHSAY